MKLNVVSFQMPLPADYGGVIDVYHKLRALSEAGVGLTLHTFIYGDRRPDRRLLDLCEAVFYYPRLTGLRSQLSLRPYIVESRRNRTLTGRLLASHAPVLLEGLHCCGLLGELAAAGKCVGVRTHNVEHDYYAGLASHAPAGSARTFFRIEAERLRRFERVLSKASVLFPISRDDEAYFSRRFPSADVRYTPPFFNDSPEITAPTTAVDVLYHGNLAVAENVEALRFILHRVMPMTRSGARLTVAGRAPSAALRAEVEAAGATLHADVTAPELEGLIASARINLLVTGQATGMKLKLMNVLAAGTGHCLVNPAMVTDAALGRFCTVADGAEALAAAVDRLMSTPRSAADAMRLRGEFLREFGTQAGAATIIRWILQNT